MAWKLLCGAFIGVLLVAAGLMAVSCKSASHSPQLWERYLAAYPEGDIKTMKWDSPPKMIIDTSKKYTATIETEKGNLVLELFAKDAPVTVNNFVFLSLAGYYNDVTFHRVIMGFVAQGGDPNGTGLGGPGYTFANEITEHKHVAGAISMAHSSQPDSNGSQFFICYDDLSQLDGGYSVFGELVGGWDSFLKLTPRDPSEFPQFTGDKILRIIITEE
jgi:cyclophilin family peptidyl-prolyl cis-trans isomerase